MTHRVPVDRRPPLRQDLLQDILARVAERLRVIVRGGDPEPYVRRMPDTRAVDGGAVPAPV